jgi:lipopolysaccharide export LptBFGC system permease protein LptF
MVFYYVIRALGLIFDLLPEMVLIAGVLAATTMVRNNEHLILKSTGMRLQRAFGPILLLATTIAIGVSLARETVWPQLVIERDRLKPYVYHKPPKAKSMTGLAMDEKNRAVIYSINMYNRDSKQCRGFNVYFPEEAVDGRIPYLSADYATWDYEKDEWKLSTFEGLAKQKKQSGKSKKGETGGAAALPAPTAEFDPKDDKRNQFGHIFSPEGDGSKSGSVMWKAHELARWKGTLTPNFLDSERYGPSVMSMWELFRQKEKIGYRAEIWRRLFEWVIAGTLLMCCIPWLVKQDVRSAMSGVAISILFGLAYRLAVMGSFELVHSEYVNFAPLPLLPHLGFLALGLWSYFAWMDT